MKKVFLFLLSIMLVIPLTACNSKKEEEEPNISKEEQAVTIEDQTIGNLSFESFNVVLDSNNVSHVYFEVINNEAVSNNSSQVIFTLYRDGVKIITLSKSLNAPIKPNDMRVIEAEVDIDLSKIDKVEYIVE